MMFMNMKLIHSYKYTEYATKLHLKPMRLMNETKVIKQIPVGLTIRARITMMGINSTNISKTNNNLPSQLVSKYRSHYIKYSCLVQLHVLL
jgi:acyl-CoA hydrolase